MFFQILDYYANKCKHFKRHFVYVNILPLHIQCTVVPSIEKCFSNLNYICIVLLIKSFLLCKLKYIKCKKKKRKKGRKCVLAYLNQWYTVAFFF